MPRAWIDGALPDKLDARVGVYDHGFLFGDGVAEGMRAHGGRVFRLADHLARLRASADFLSLKVPLSDAQLTAAIAETLRANNRSDGYVRVMVTRGPGTLGLDPRKCEPTVVVVAEDVMDYPRELYDAGLDVVTTPAVGFVHGVTLLARPADVLAKASALKAGCLDALLLDHTGHVVGSTDGTVFAVRGGDLFTHPGTHVARAVVLELAGGPAHEGPLSVAAADEVFLASTAAEVIAVARIDGAPVGAGGEGPVTRRLRGLYRDAARRGYTEGQ
jgi:branched-chain amino acid aminotransferase